MEKELDPGSRHAHPYIQAPTDPNIFQPFVIPRPFRLCDVHPADRATWCMQAAFELASLKCEAYHLGTAYDRACTIPEKQLLLASIITMNGKGRSRLAAILEALVGLERSVWSVFIGEEMENDLANVMRFDMHCRARLVALNANMEAIAAAETQRSINEAVRVDMLQRQPGNSISATGNADTDLKKPVQETPRRSRDTDEHGSTVVGMNIHDSQSTSNEWTNNWAQSEAGTENRTPFSLRRPQFGSMTLADSNSYSSWRASGSE